MYQQYKTPLQLLRHDIRTERCYRMYGEVIISNAWNET
jgi:hypothetical protein